MATVQVARTGVPLGVNSVYLAVTLLTYAGKPVSPPHRKITQGGDSFFCCNDVCVGTQQAMASFALRDVAPASTVTAYSLAQQMILIAWNITFGLVAMASTFGWSATKDMVRESRKKSKEKRSLSDLEKEDDAEQGS